MNQHIQLYSSYRFLFSFLFYLAIIFNLNVITGSSSVNFSVVTHAGLLQSFIPHRPCPCKLKFILSVFKIQSTADKTKSVSCFFLFWWSVTLRCMSQYRGKHLWLYQFLCDFNHFHLFHDLDCPTPRHLNRLDYLNKEITTLKNTHLKSACHLNTVSIPDMTQTTIILSIYGLLARIWIKHQS